MGIYFFDQYSLLHFAAGVVGYHFGIPLWLWIIINIIFEYVENTSFGINLINKFPIWPGGKKFADSMLNRVGDIFFVILGWLAGYGLDYLGKKYGWFSSTG